MVSSKILLLTAIISSIAFAAVNVDYTLLDMMCSQANPSDNCDLLKSTPDYIPEAAFIKGLGSVGCVATNNKCAFDRTLSCRQDGLGKYVQTTLTNLATCATADGDMCPIGCVNAVLDLASSELLLAGVTDFPSAADLKNIENIISKNIQKDSISQILICAAQTLSPFQEKAVLKWGAWSKTVNPNDLKSLPCVELDYDKAKNAFDAAKNTVTKIDQALPPKTSAASVISGILTLIAVAFAIVIV